MQRDQREIEAFFRCFLDSPNRKLLLIAGAGFDPRSTTLTECVARLNKAEKAAVFIREERPMSTSELRERADANAAKMCGLVRDAKVIEVPIFAGDNAVIGGREMVRILGSLDLTGITDVLLDVSAISTGVYFPAAKYLHGVAMGDANINLHLFVSQGPDIDHGIRGISCDMPAPVHAFRGKLGLDETARAAKLWLPQFVPGRRTMFERLFQFLSVDDVCPILPFPCMDPRFPDKLVVEYREPLIAWEVDYRNCVYAAENDPLDLYRTILRLDDARKRIFAEAGGSLLIISPTGSKILSVGGLLAALDRDLPVVLIESLGYEVDLAAFERSLGPDHPSQLVHAWLDGEAYSAI